MLVDAHQHLWIEEFIRALERRSEPPFVRREHGSITLHSDGELAYVIDTGSVDPESRAALVREDGLDFATVAISSPIGVEALPRSEAGPLLDAWLEGAFALPSEFGVWGPFALDDPHVDDIDLLMERGCVGVSIPAGALAGPTRLRALRPILRRIAELGVPLFVHPGRAPGQKADTAEHDEPLWWRPLTDYVWQMQAAWYMFAAEGRREHPSLTILWTMLAGGAPLLHERFTARGGPQVDLRDPHNFYDTSSYGPAAIDATVALVGEGQLVYGSDRPVIGPAITARDRRLQINSATLIQGANRARKAYA